MPGNSKESLLFKVASHAVEPHMPFKAEKLSEADLADIAEWIDRGAVYGSRLPLPKPVNELHLSQITGRSAFPVARLCPSSGMRNGGAIPSTLFSPWSTANVLDCPT